MRISEILLLSLCLSIASAELPSYTRCFTAHNVKGLCVHINECEPIMDQIRAGTVRSNPPAICSHAEKTVCCPLKGLKRNLGSVSNRKDENFEQLTTDAILVPYGGIEETVMEASVNIAKKKCEEYGEAVIENAYITSTLRAPPRQIQLSKCLHKSVPLIVGGSEARPNEFPHQALLGYKREQSLKTKWRWLCGGSLISKNFVLTAAHCIWIKDIGAPYLVKLGMNALSDGGIVFEIEEIYRHGSFKHTKSAVIGDVALIKLKNEVAINEYILPICLPTQQYHSKEAIATGFGRTESDNRSERLMKVKLKKFDLEKCKQAWRYATIDESMLCYGHDEVQRDSCNGDSGGPLQISNEKHVKCTYTQIGIVSFGAKDCGTIGLPGIYVSVYHYLDWITDIIWADEK